MDSSVLFEMLGFEDSTFTESFETNILQALFKHVKENEAPESWFERFYKIIAFRYINSITNEFQKPRNGYIRKIFTDIPINYKEIFLALTSPVKIQKVNTFEPIELDEDDDEENDKFTFSLVNEENTRLNDLTAPITRKNNNHNGGYNNNNNTNNNNGGYNNNNNNNNNYWLGNQHEKIEHLPPREENRVMAARNKRYDRKSKGR